MKTGAGRKRVYGRRSVQVKSVRREGGRSKGRGPKGTGVREQVLGLVKIDE